MSAKIAYHYHLSKWSDIQDHLPLLKKSAKGNCLEIGVRTGVSTSALLAGVEENGGHLYSVDVNPCHVFAGHPHWTFMQADSIAHKESLKSLVPDKLSLLFVDGDHTYEGALSDLKTFGILADKILVHDTEAPDFPGVRKAVEEFAEEHGRKVTFHSGSYGMAEISS